MDLSLTAFYFQAADMLWLKDSTSRVYNLFSLPSKMSHWGGLQGASSPELAHRLKCFLAHFEYMGKNTQGPGYEVAVES